MRENEQFRIEVVTGDQAQVFNIKPLGHARYEIFKLHAIREQIQFHQQWKHSH